VPITRIATFPVAIWERVRPERPCNNPSSHEACGIDKPLTLTRASRIQGRALQSGYDRVPPQTPAGSSRSPLS
jgi:hypothetical protein